MLNTSAGRSRRFIDLISPEILMKPSAMREQRVLQRQDSRRLNQNTGFKYFKFNLLKNKVQKENMVPKALKSNQKTIRLRGTQAKQQSSPTIKILLSPRPTICMKPRQKPKEEEERLIPWEITY